MLASRVEPSAAQTAAAMLVARSPPSLSAAPLPSVIVSPDVASAATRPDALGNRHSFFGGFAMRRTPFFVMCLAVATAQAGRPAKGPTLIARPEAFKTLVSPDCSHCKTENLRRKADL